DSATALAGLAAFVAAQVDTHPGSNRRLLGTEARRPRLLLRARRYEQLRIGPARGQGQEGERPLADRLPEARPQLTLDQRDELLAEWFLARLAVDVVLGLAAPAPGVPRA